MAVTNIAEPERRASFDPVQALLGVNWGFFVSSIVLNVLRGGSTPFGLSIDGSKLLYLGATTFYLIALGGFLLRFERFVTAAHDNTGTSYMSAIISSILPIGLAIAMSVFTSFYSAVTAFELATPPLTLVAWVVLVFVRLGLKLKGQADAV